MRAVKDSNLPKQDNGHTAALSFGDFSPKFHEQCFDVAPLDVPARWAANDQFEAPCAAGRACGAGLKGSG
jgi:hypothetical protein